MRKLTISIKTLLLTLPIFVFTPELLAQEKQQVHINDQDPVTNVNRMFNNGQWEQGKEILDKQVQSSPNDTDIRMLLGKYYFHHKQYDKARYELVKALDIKSDNIDAKHILVNLEMQTKRYSSAICYVNELLEVSPYLESLWQKKIDLYALQGNQVEVRRLQKRLAQIYPENQKIRDSYLYSLETQIIADKNAGNLDKVMEQSLELVKQDPNQLDYLLQAVNNFIKIGDYYSAMSYVDRGLLQFGLSGSLVEKKIALLQQQKRYEELLSFLKENKLEGQYRVYLLEAARSARAKEPLELYVKVLETSPGNAEAYGFVFAELLSRHEYEQALIYLNKFKAVNGNSKDLLIQEMNLYKKMGNFSRANTLVKELFLAYNQDEELKQDYLEIIHQEAKEFMEQERYVEAIASWYELSHYGDMQQDRLAQQGIFKSYYNLGDYNSALNTLTNLMLFNPNDTDLLLKRADIYLKQGNYPRAVSSFELILQDTDSFDHPRFLGGYQDMLTQIIKDLNQQYEYQEALRYAQMWLKQDPVNKQALIYAINLANQTGQLDLADSYLSVAKANYPNEVFFKVKSINLDKKQELNLAQSYQGLIKDLQENPYHKDLLNTLEQIGQDYTLDLVKQNQNDLALQTIDQALSFFPTSRTLNYTKGVVLEKRKEYDKAYYYLSFYQPGILEAKDFKSRLEELEYKSKRNEIGIQYLTSRYNQEVAKTTVTEVQYVRFQDKNTYSAKLGYTARETGKGLQGFAQWDRIWTKRISTSAHVGIGDEFFPRFIIGGSVYREFDFWNSTQIELGVGYRKFNQTQNVQALDKGMFNIVGGITKYADKFSLNLRFNNYFLQSDYSYNLALNANYYLSSSKHFLTGLASIGTSPDAEYIDYSIYDSFSVLNTNLGLGYGFLIYKNVSGKALGTWYNYKVDDQNFRNLFNFYFSLNVAF
ncbi:tetratricopeptide repeat protein [Myroides sp. LJL119]